MFPTVSRMAVLVPVLAGGLALAACNRETQTNAPRQEQEGRILSRVDLDQPVRVLGNEPFWHVDINPSSLTFGTPEGRNQIAENPGAILEGNTAVWNTQTQAGMPLKVTLLAQDCSDGMSDRIYPLTAEVEVGPDSYAGCAASLTALERAGESGRVE